ncbi:hypothetical protein TNCV_286991 [Trichonephila clavipes]|nr:hypothetical protein TNCV_286991 [Trichonephila clavipes]
MICTDERCRVRRNPEKHMNAFYLAHIVQESGGCNLIWHVPLTWKRHPGFLEGKQTDMRYLGTLVDQVHPTIITLMPIDTSWTIMQLYKVPDVFKFDSLQSNTFPGHRIPWILTPQKMCYIWWKDASKSPLFFHPIYKI